MKTEEIRGFNPVDIERKIKETKAAIFKLKIKLSTKQLENTAEIKKLRRSIALMETILTEKKKGKGVELNAGKK